MHQVQHPVTSIEPIGAHLVDAEVGDRDVAIVGARHGAMRVGHFLARGVRATALMRHSRHWRADAAIMFHWKHGNRLRRAGTARTQEVIGDE